MGLWSAIKSLFGGGTTAVPKLQPGDRMLTCEDCKSQFVFDAGEQQFFKEKGFTEPKRCPKCRKKVRFRMRRRGRGGHGGEDRGGQERGGQNHGGGQGGHNQGGQNKSPSNDNQHGRRGRPHGRRHSVIDGDSPYADER